MTDLLPDEPLHRLRARRSTKWRAHSPEGLPPSIAGMDFAPPDGLGEALAGFAERRWGWRIDPAAATATTDVSAGVVEMLRLFTSPGDRVVINPPGYSPFFDWLQEASPALPAVPLGD